MEKELIDENSIDTIPYNEILLTTEDNPFDPFTQPDRWHTFDTVTMGYDTWGNIVRLAHLSDNLTPEEERQRIRWAKISLANTGLVRGSHSYSRYRLVTKGDASVF